MFNQIKTWYQAHGHAILVTAIAVSNAGLLGKAGSAIVQALAVICGVAQ